MLQPRQSSIGGWQPLLAAVACCWLPLTNAGSVSQECRSDCANMDTCSFFAASSSVSLTASCPANVRFSNLASLANVGTLFVSDDSGFVSLSFPKLFEAASVSLSSLSGLQTVSFPLLTEALKIHMRACNSLISVSLPKLASMGVFKQVTEALSLDSNFNLRTVSLPSLTSISGNLLITDNGLLEEVEVPLLTRANCAQMLVRGNDKLQTLRFPPAFRAGFSQVTVQNNAALTIVSLGATTGLASLQVTDNGSLLAVEAKDLVTVQDTLSLASNSFLASAAFPLLRLVGHSLQLTALPALASLSLPRLSTIGCLGVISGLAALQELHLPNMRTLSSDKGSSIVSQVAALGPGQRCSFTLEDNAAMVSFAAPRHSAQHFNGRLRVRRNPSLAKLQLGGGDGESGAGLACSLELELVGNPLLGGVSVGAYTGADERVAKSVEEGDMQAVRLDRERITKQKEALDSLNDLLGLVLYLFILVALFWATLSFLFCMARYLYHRSKRREGKLAKIKGDWKRSKTQETGNQGEEVQDKGAKVPNLKVKRKKSGFFSSFFRGESFLNRMSFTAGAIQPDHLTPAVVRTLSARNSQQTSRRNSHGNVHEDHFLPLSVTESKRLLLQPSPAKTVEQQPQQQHQEALPPPSGQPPPLSMGLDVIKPTRIHVRAAGSTPSSRQPARQPKTPAFADSPFASPTATPRGGGMTSPRRQLFSPVSASAVSFVTAAPPRASYPPPQASQEEGPRFPLSSSHSVKRHGEHSPLPSKLPPLSAHMRALRFTGAMADN